METEKNKIKSIYSTVEEKLSPKMRSLRVSVGKFFAPLSDTNFPLRLPIRLSTFSNKALSVNRKG